MAKQYVEIVGGPSKWDLMLGLFDSKSSDSRSLEFVLETKEIIEVEISSVEREDGSGESWNIKAYPRRYSQKIGSGLVNIYFSTVSRRGTFIHTEPHE